MQRSPGLLQLGLRGAVAVAEWQTSLVNPGLTTADYVTRAMLLSSMVAVPTGIVPVALRAAVPGSILVGLGFSGTIGVGIVRAGLARAFTRDLEDERERSTSSS